MPLELTETEVTQTVVTQYNITEFTVDVGDSLVSGRYLKSDAEGNPIAYDNLRLSAEDSIATIARASEIAGADVYAAIKAALYEAVQVDAGVTGSVV